MTASPEVPAHIAFIPDGNRRFARALRLDVEQAYQAGAQRGVDAVGWCVEAGVRHISTYASSLENLTRRDTRDMDAVDRAVTWFCKEVRARHDVAVHLVGELESLANLDASDDAADRDTRTDRPVVHVAVRYSLEAELAARGSGSLAVVPPIDLVIRPGGQQRLSGFFPLQTRFAELWFCDTLWPAFREAEFRAALAWYAAQERRWGE